MSLIRINHGRVFDPVNHVDGIIQDLWIKDGKIVDVTECQNIAPTRSIDATGLIVMPGGVDMHCHIAGSKVNAARKMRPEDKSRLYETRGMLRGGTGGTVPSSFTTGYLYAGLGYTSAVDAAIPPMASLHVHEEFVDTPLLDKGFLITMGDHRYGLQELANGNREQFQNFIGWIINATKALGIKVVNPGGIEVWKQNGGTVRSIDDQIPGYGVTPRSILWEMAHAVDSLKLPHPMHLHCTNLGLPGNAEVTLETMQALEGHRGHLAHIQFHSYGGDPDDQSTMFSRVPELVDYVSQNQNLSVDVGQVMFGPATAMTGDSALGYFLHQALGEKWYSADLEIEGGCGIVPITYKHKSFVHALQWAIGLEWYLLMPDPWRIAMSTDHPNGAAFLSYPEIIALLMSRDLRQSMLQKLPALIQERCSLSEITREYSLYEIAIITRAAPARILGLKDKGHLGVGADADVTLYQPDGDIQKMFELPRYVIQGGEVILDQGELIRHRQGTTLYSQPAFDSVAVPSIEKWFNENYSIRFRNYGVEPEFLNRARAIRGE